MPIHQEVTINARPEAVYDLLLDSTRFTEMTGGRAAVISREEGGRSTMFGGDIAAHNVELVPGKRVVQAWRPVRWPEGHYSLVRFELTPEGKGTKLVFDQIGYPEEDFDMLNGGWPKMYWEPMSATLAA
jgi:activator of HSP90 ATPase